MEELTPLYTMILTNLSFIIFLNLLKAEVITLSATSMIWKNLFQTPYPILTLFLSCFHCELLPNLFTSHTLENTVENSCRSQNIQIIKIKLIKGIADKAPYQRDSTSLWSQSMKWQLKLVNKWRRWWHLPFSSFSSWEDFVYTPPVLD